LKVIAAQVRRDLIIRGVVDEGSEVNYGAR
jgi:hypothetical protein